MGDDDGMKRNKATRNEVTSQSPRALEQVREHVDSQSKATRLTIDRINLHGCLTFSDRSPGRG